MFELSSYQQSIEKCSSCKFCQATCPVFKEDLLETHNANARLALIQAGLVEKKLPLSQRFYEVLDRCLLCTTCASACPAKIPIEEVIISARFQIRKDEPKTALEKFKRRFMEKRGLGELLGKIGALASQIGLMPADFPKPANKPFSSTRAGIIPAEKEKRARVIYFVGCATNAFYPETAEDVVSVLTKNRIEVLIPEGMVCCGLPALADGDLELARELVQKNVQALSQISADALVTDCSSCGMVLKTKLSKILPENHPLKPSAELISGRVFEVTDYLNQKRLLNNPSELSVNYTYHIPCHRGWSPGLRDAPRALLSRIPKANLIEMASPENCCGAGGFFFYKFRDLSRNIRSHKIQDILKTKAEIVITQCPACRSYLSSALKEHKFMHPISLLARAYKI